MISISWNFPSGSMASAGVSGDHIHLRPRTYPFTHGTTAWWNYFRVDGAKDRTLAFQFDAPEIFVHGHHEATRYVISYDQEVWGLPDRTTGAGNDYRFTHRFTEDTAWVAYGLPYPVSRLDAKISEWSRSPWVQPTASSGVDLKLNDLAQGGGWQTPGGENEVGFTIPRQPLDGFCATDPTGNEAKANVVLMAGSHSGEPVSNHVLEGLMDWLLGETVEAGELRRTARCFVYPLADPDGRYGGYSRCNQLRPLGDHNRLWDAPAEESLPEIVRLKQAMREDTKGEVAFFLDIHNQAQAEDQYLIVNDGWEDTPFVRGMQRRLDPFRIELSTTWNTQVAKSWAREGADGLGAATSITLEPGSWPVTTPDAYHEYGRAMGCSLFDALVGR